MAVTNTVQGLNSVIDLLKNILDTVKDDNKTVQPRDVSSVSRTTASNKNNIQDLSALNSISGNIQTNAKTYSDVIKTITSNDVISGIKNLAILKMMGLTTAFSGAIGIIVEAFNKMNDLKVNKKKIDNFTNVSNAIASSLKSVTITLYGLAGLIVVAAGIGLLVPVAWPQILIGFGAISATLMGIMMLGIMCAGIIAIVEKLSNNKLKPTDQIKSMFGDNPNVFKDISILILSMAGIILISALIGLLVPVAWPQILIGFGAISAVLLGTLAIIWLASKVATLDNFKCILSTALILYALAGLVIISSLVGKFAQENYPSIADGFILLGSILIGVAILTRLVNWISKGVKKTSIIVLGLIVGIMYALLGLVFLITIISNKVAETPTGALIGTITILAGMIIATIVLMNVIGAISTNPMVWIGGIVMVAIAAVLYALVTVIEKMVDISIKIKKAKAELGDDLFAGLGKAGWQIGWAFTTISAGLAIAMIPIALISPFIGKMKKVLNVISKFLDMVSKYTFDGDEMYTVIYDDNGKPIKGVSINMVKTSHNIASAFGKFVNILTKEFSNISLLGLFKMSLAFKPISKMLNPVAKFVEILKTFSASDGLISLCTTETDNEGNLITTGTQSLNLTLVAMNISNAFSEFVKILAEKFETIDVSGKMKRQGKRLMKMIDPIHKFVEIISKIEIDNPVTKVTVVGEDGKKTTLNNPLATISGIATLIGEFSNIFTEDGKQLSRREANTLKIQLDAMTEFINSIANSVSSLEKITLKKPIDNNIWKTINTIYKFKDKTVLEQHANDIDIFVESWEKLDKVIFKNEKNNIESIKRYTEAVKELANEFKNVSSSVESIAQIQIQNNSNKNGVNGNQQNNNSLAQNNNSTSVETRVTEQTQSTSQIDTGEIAEAIKSGLTGATVRFTFADSMDDFIGEMALS